MSTNDRYELIGGILYNTPIDDTSDSIQSDYYQRAVEVADKLLSVKEYTDISKIVISIDDELVNYMNSPLIDLIRKYPYCFIGETLAVDNVNIIKFIIASKIIEGSEIDLLFHDAVYRGSINVVKYLSITFDIKIASNKYKIYQIKSKKDCAVVEYINKNGAPLKMNDRYEIFGGVLYNTPVDDTNDQIQSDYYKFAVEIADKLLVANGLDEIQSIVRLIRQDIIDYMNSPLVDVLMLDDPIIWGGCNLITLKYLETHNVHISPEHYMHILNEACKSGNFDIIKYLQNKGMSLEKPHNDQIRFAIVWDQFEVVQYIIESKSTKNTYTSVLIEALKYNNIDMVKFAIENGADINDANILIGVKKVIEFGNLDILKYLIEHNLKPTNDNKYSFMMTAARHGFLHIVKYLVDQNVNINDELIEIALIHGHLDIAKYMINGNLNISIQRIIGFSLIETTKKGHLDVVKYLISEHHPLITAEFYTAMIYALANERSDIHYCLRAYLLSKGLSDIY